MWHWTKYFWLTVIFTISFIGIGWADAEKHTTGTIGLEYHHDVQVLATMVGLYQPLTADEFGEFGLLTRLVVGRNGTFDMDLSYMLNLSPKIMAGVLFGPSVSWEDVPEDGENLETYWTATCGLIAHYYIGGGFGVGGGCKYKYYDGERYPNGWTAGAHLTKRF